MKRDQRLLRGSLRAGAGGLLVVGVMAAALWGTVALWFALPAEAGARLIVAVLFAGLGIGGLVMALRRRRMFLALLPFTIAFMVLLLWWSTIEPSNDRAWQPDVARLPSAEVDGDFVTLRNIRSFDYRSAADYTEHWYDRTFDLRRLDSLDLIAVYWMGDAIAHTMLSFGFAGEPVTISIETRKERGEEYSALAGFFRRYELYYVVGDERDLIGLRTTYRAPPEDVYLYRVHARRENIHRLFSRVPRQDQPAARTARVLQYGHHELHDQHRDPCTRIAAGRAPGLENAAQRLFPGVRVRPGRARPEPPVRGAPPAKPDQ
jgi:Domain of unknown function (DUF4105)